MASGKKSRYWLKVITDGGKSGKDSGNLSSRTWFLDQNAHLNQRQSATKQLYKLDLKCKHFTTRIKLFV